MQCEPTLGGIFYKQTKQKANIKKLINQATKNMVHLNIYSTITNKTSLRCYYLLLNKRILDGNVFEQGQCVVRVNWEVG